MTVKEFTKKIKAVVERQAKVGMTLELNGKTMMCIGTEESSYGTRYIFDSGVSFTKSNIVSNIVKCAAAGQSWDFKF